MLVPIGALVIYAVTTSNLWAAAVAVLALAVAVGLLQGQA